MTKSNFVHITTLTLLAVALVGCAGMAKPTPDLMPSEKLRATPTAQVQSDINECLGYADMYVRRPHDGKMVFLRSFGSAVAGTAAGAIGGTIYGNPGRATAVGAATGGLLGMLSGLADTTRNDPYYERFVERCLQNKGYEVVGWSIKR